MIDINTTEINPVAGLTREVYVAKILKCVRRVSTGIESLAKERRELNDTFGKLALLPNRTDKLNAFNMLSLLSDDIDNRHASLITELHSVVGMIDTLQNLYGEDKALSNIRDFYMNNVL